MENDEIGMELFGDYVLFVEQAIDSCGDNITDIAAF